MKLIMELISEWEVILDLVDIIKRKCYHQHPCALLLLLAIWPYLNVLAALPSVNQLNIIRNIELHGLTWSGHVWTKR